MALRILVLEDHDRTRETLVRALSRARDWDAVGGATISDALSLARASKPDIALVDLRLREEKGEDAIRELVGLGVPCVALTALADAPDVLGALRAGASGYVVKGDPFDRVLLAIEEVLSGRAALSSQVTQHLVDAVRPSDPPIALTARERDVLIALARGLTYAEVATVLSIKVTTVQTYVKTLYSKLDVNTKAEACAWALRHGLLQ